MAIPWFSPPTYPGNRKLSQIVSEICSGTVECVNTKLTVVTISPTQKANNTLYPCAYHIAQSAAITTAICATTYRNYKFGIKMAGFVQHHINSQQGLFTLAPLRCRVIFGAG
jgi:hypothetical protein